MTGYQDSVLDFYIYKKTIYYVICIQENELFFVWGDDQMENKQALPEYLKQLRKFHCYKQRDIAEQLNITRQTYSHYETGRIKPSVDVLFRLAKIYGISVDDILRQAVDNKQDLSGNDLSVKDTGGASDNLFQKDFLACFQSLNEKDRKETLSIMWEIMQVKKKTEGN